MKTKQAFNPYLPSYEYVPDAEPHIVDGRIYIYGSHDLFNGLNFCLGDYVCWSAPVDDLGNWKYEGCIYKSSTATYTIKTILQLEKKGSHSSLIRRFLWMMMESFIFIPVLRCREIRFFWMDPNLQSMDRCALSWIRQICSP